MSFIIHKSLSMPTLISNIMWPEYMYADKLSNFDNNSLFRKSTFDTRLQGLDETEVDDIRVTQRAKFLKNVVAACKGSLFNKICYIIISLLFFIFHWNKLKRANC